MTTTMFATSWHPRKKDCAAGAACLMYQKADGRSVRTLFGSYNTWDDAYEKLKHVRCNKQYLHEVIPSSRPCKPFLEIDLPAAPYGALDALMASADALLVSIFADDYQVTMSAADFVCC